MKVKSVSEFKILLVYPNLSMLYAPPLAMAIFTSLLRKVGYQVELFDATPYVGEGASAQEEVTFVGDEMNTIRADHKDDKNKITLDTKTTAEKMGELMQARPFSFKENFDIESKVGLHEDFIKKVDDFKPDLMITSSVEDTFLQLVDLMSLVSEYNIPAIHGGVFITSAPELAMSYNGLNMIGIGEGEQIVLDIADHLRRGISCENVPGVWIKKEEGQIIKNDRGALFDFKSVIPDFSLFDSDRFYRPMGGQFFKATPIESYRGCPYSCAYCNSPMQSTLSKEANIGNFVRRSPIDKTRNYIASVIEQVNPTFLIFVDDSFLARPKKEIESFCKMYEEFKIPFWFNTRPETVTPEILKMLKEVNCYRMSFGLECGNEEFRSKRLLRHQKNVDVIKTFEIIANGGIPYSVNNIIGFPGETRELIFETIELNRQIPAYDALTVSVFVPYHGTVLRDDAVKAGFVDKNSIVSDLHKSTLDMPQLPAEEINGLLRTFPLYVHFDKSIWPDIKRAELNDKEGNEIFKKLSAQYQKEAFSVDQYEKMQQYSEVKGSVGCASNELDTIRVLKMNNTCS